MPFSHFSEVLPPYFAAVFLTMFFPFPWLSFELSSRFCPPPSTTGFSHTIVTQPLASSIFTERVRCSSGRESTASIALSARFERTVM